MKLFMKEKRLLMIVQFVQFLAIVTLFYLAGFRDIWIILYSFLISSFIFSMYIVYDYLTRKEAYQRLSSGIESLDESLQVGGDAPLTEALQELLRAQYHVYQRDISQLEGKQQEHLIFMDRWIHQMKTPLSVIDLMATDLDEPLSSNMREETERMKTGLNTVLYMARLRTIEQDFHIRKVNVISLIHEVNQEHKRFYIRNKVYPVMKAEQEYRVETDEKWLYFILTQLIQNAVKYSTGKADKIEISVGRIYGITHVEVRDFGVGIPQADITRLFDAFFTGENGRKFRESTGMGLFLVKEVADYLGHEVSVESELGEGTSFKMFF